MKRRKRRQVSLVSQYNRYKLDTTVDDINFFDDEHDDHDGSDFIPSEQQYNIVTTIAPYIGDIYNFYDQTTGEMIVSFDQNGSQFPNNLLMPSKYSRYRKRRPKGSSSNSQQTTQKTVQKINTDELKLVFPSINSEAANINQNDQIINVTNQVGTSSKSNPLLESIPKPINHVKYFFGQSGRRSTKKDFIKFKIKVDTDFSAAEGLDAKAEDFGIIVTGRTVGQMAPMAVFYLGSSMSRRSTEPADFMFGEIDVS